MTTRGQPATAKRNIKKAATAVGGKGRLRICGERNGLLGKEGTKVARQKRARTK